MALFLNNNQQRTLLQEKIAADLDTRLKARDNHSTPNPKPQPAILDNQAPASKTTWVWLLAAVLAAAVFIWVVFETV